MNNQELIQDVEKMMNEASKLSGQIGFTNGSHPAMYAVNRAWNSLSIARDELAKTVSTAPTKREETP